MASNRNRRSVNNSSDEHLWLISYADLLGAILVIMVIFVSFSKIDIEKFDAMQRAFNDQQVVETTSLVDLEAKLIAVAQQNHLENEITIQLNKEGLEINFVSAALFHSNSSKLDARQIQRFNPVLDVIIEDGLYRQIDVSGHTDDVPIRHGSNWDLSARRSFSMHQYLLSKGMNESGSRLIAYAQTKPKVDPKGLEGVLLDNARENNRRVSILIGRQLNP